MPPALTLTLGTVRVAPWLGGVWNREREVGEGRVHLETKMMLIQQNHSREEVFFI